MPLWRKQPWPDDPPKGNGTTIKGIETFGDRAKKEYQDSLNLYKFTDWHNNMMSEISGKPTIILSKRYQNISKKDWEKHYNESLKWGEEYAKVSNTGAVHWKRNDGSVDPYPTYNRHIAPSGYNETSTHGDYIPFYKKPTGNGLKPQLSKMPIIKPELQSSYIKFRPATPLPEGNVELQNTGYTNVGMRKKPDGTRFIYDKSGKTDKTVTIDDNRIGFEYYIKKLYE